MLYGNINKCARVEICECQHVYGLIGYEDDEILILQYPVLVDDMPHCTEFIPFNGDSIEQHKFIKSDIKIKYCCSMDTINQTLSSYKKYVESTL